MAGFNFSGARRAWSSVAGQATAVTWTNFSAFGPDTINQGGGVPIPSWAKGIDLIKIGATGNLASAIGTISGVRLGRAIYPATQFLLGPSIGGATTSALGAACESQVIALNTGAPMFRITPGGRLVVDGTAGSGDPGQMSMVVSIRWTEEAVAKPLYCLAAQAQTTAATDLLSTALTALGGDTNFPANVPANAEGVRLLETGFASDTLAAGETVGEFRLNGKGLPDAPIDICGPSVMSESGAATTCVAALCDLTDEWLAVSPGDPISAVFGYTGVDSGTEAGGIMTGFQLSG